MNNSLLKKSLNTELCVIGGGLAGCFTALSAARHGVKVVLVQDRPVLGGNASSEVRMWVRGARGKFNREVGLISELEERNIHFNPTLNHSVFDATLYAMLAENENITLFLNASVLDAKTENGKICSVTAWQTNTYTFIEVFADNFADCSGDSILATLTGAEYTKGRESKSQYGESLAKDQPDDKTMGMSIILGARETDKPVKFIPPTFAYKYTSDADFSIGNYIGEGVQVRAHNVGTSNDNLWWIELGGDMDSIHDANKVGAELIKCVYGVWDHIKNYGDHGKENWDLDWVGFLPGKRESRRYIGDYVVAENDLRSGGDFYDEVAFGGWPMDDHNPSGMKQGVSDLYPSVMVRIDKPYGLPLRALYSKNIKNLCFAGRNVSVTHVALSSTRVMATCSLLGQALGTAISVAKENSCDLRTVANEYYKQVQKRLTDDGVYLPHVKREISDILKNADFNISDKDKSILLNGHDRPIVSDNENYIELPLGKSLIVDLKNQTHIDKIRLVFDPDFSRESVSENYKMRIYAMKLHTGFDFKPVKTARSIVKDLTIYADNKEIISVKENYLSILVLPINRSVSEIKIKFNSTHGLSVVRLFSLDFI